MSDPREVHERAGHIFEIVLRLGLVFALLAWGVRIVAPFLHPIAWGVILAVALHPPFARVSALLGGRPRTTGALLVVGAIALVIVPAGMLAAGSVEGAHDLAEQWQAGELKVPPPRESVRQVPVVGETVYGAWLDASSNLEAAVKRFAPQLQAVGRWLVGLAKSAGSVLVLLVFSVVIAAALLMNGDTCTRFASTLATRVAGEQGDEFLDLTVRTIRGVAVGVIGTAAIQAAAAALGFVVMDLPLAGLWAVLVLVLAVIQLPPTVVLLPIAIWSFSAYDTLPASGFAVWCVAVAGVDNVLKPILMGRGLDIPMLVLLVGSLGGMLLSGIMGLFVGAVVLAVIYRLFGAWLHIAAPEPEEEAASA